MPGFGTGLKAKLTLSRCTVSNGKISVTGDKFGVMINPSQFTHEHSITYAGSNPEKSKKKPLGEIGNELKFNTINPEKLGFKIVIDGTGVVNASVPGGGSPDVKTQVENLKKIVYNYDGRNHEPNIVNILWGNFSFDGRLESLSVEYTLFKPSGEPLRANVTLSFAQHLTKEEQLLLANKSSPDLTHVVEVRAGDTLPQLCYRIYNDGAYYPEIAKANNLTHFRDLRPGLRLHFPPLR